MSTKKSLQSEVRDLRNEISDEDFDAWEWLANISCTSIMKAPDGDFQGIEILFAGGGPTITVDTRYSIIEGVWGNDNVTVCYRDEGRLNEAAEQMYGE